MKQVLVLHTHDGTTTAQVEFLGNQVTIQRIGCNGNLDQARSLIAEYDGKVDAIAVVGMPAELHLGKVRRTHHAGATLPKAARQTPVVDGSGIRAELERWGMILVDRASPGIVNQKHVLFVPGLNHEGLAQAIERRTPDIRFADPVLFFGLPDAPGIGDRRHLAQVAAPTLERLQDAPLDRFDFEAITPHALSMIDWADVLVGDIQAIRNLAPPALRHKIVIAESATDEDVADLRIRGVTMLITLMPSLAGKGQLGQDPAAVIEALLVAVRTNPNAPLTEDSYLDLLATLDWAPAIRWLQPEEAGINRFAFAIHPLDMRFIHKYPPMAWTKYLPDDLVETVAAYFPPLYVGKITGGRSPLTGQRIEGFLFSLGATPRMMLKLPARHTYNLLNQAARMGERMGARIMGLGAFTSVVGDAGITTANECDIAITSGNSLTVAATLEAAKQAVIQMGATDLTKGRAMVIGATGSIGSVCARLLAQAIQDVVLVSIEPEKLIDLKRMIEQETPGAHVTIATRAGDLSSDCDLIVTATSAFGQRIIDITQCKPGAVICDVARPPDINPAEAALRPDVLVIESGEVLIPGDVEIGYDIGLPPKTVYACLAETSLLAMEGRFEDYTLGRNISMERVKEIYRLFKKHGYKLAGLRSFGTYVTAEAVAEKRVLADELRADPELLARTRAAAAEQLRSIPVMSKGIPSSGKKASPAWAWIGVGAAVAGFFLMRRAQRQK